MVIEEASEVTEATEEAVEGSEIEEGEDSGGVDATNLNAFVCHICILMFSRCMIMKISEIM